MPGAIWCFSDEDRARLQPLLDKMIRRAKYAIRRCFEIASNLDDCLLLIQGASEHIADWLREEIFEQIDRGEWAGRGIKERADISITVEVDADAAYRGDANLIRLTMLPVERLS